MNKKNNFYFWFSIILLFCFLFLIFYMYQEEYEFHEIVDTKTILTVLGTLGGAFFGAYFASRYSSNLVTQQMNHQKYLIQEQSLSAGLKYSLTSTSIISNSKLMINSLVKLIEEEKEEEKLLKHLKYVEEKLELEIEELLSLNIISTLSIRMYPPIYKNLQLLYGVLDSIKEFLDRYKKEDFKVSTANRYYLKSEISDYYINIDKNLKKAFTVYKEEARERRKVLDKINLE